MERGLLLAVVLGLVIVLVTFAPAQTTQSTSRSAACGPWNVNAKVNLDESHHTLTQPNPGKARVYFIHDAGTGSTFGYPTVKVALDGAWIGANHGNSYFSVSIDPGEHHVCVSLQSSLVQQRIELAHFTAVPDAIYYYRTRLVLSRSVELLELDSIDSDQGKYLIASFPTSVFKFVKK